MTIIVTNGSDEIRAPSLSLRFATSETTTITNAVMAYFVIRVIISIIYYIINGRVLFHRHDGGLALVSAHLPALSAQQAA